MADCIVKPWDTKKYDEHWTKQCISNAAARTLTDDLRRELFESLLKLGKIDPNDSHQSIRFVQNGRRVEVKRTENDYRVFLSKNTTPSLSAKFLSFQENFGPLNGTVGDLYIKFSSEGRTLE